MDRINSLEDKERLLTADDDLSTDVSEIGIDSNIWRKPKSRRSTYVWLVRIIIASVMTASIAMNLWVIRGWIQNKDAGRLNFPFSPADEFVQFEVKDIDMNDPEDIYGGPPTNESDLAWAALVAPTAIKVTGEEMRKAGKQSIRIHSDTEEIYMGALDVYHQLHCVKRMIQNRWPARYPEVAALGAFSDEHFNHCIQVLRKGIMCSADTSVDTWTYSETGEPILHSTQRKCTNWDELHKWATSRAVGAFIDVPVYERGDDDWYGPL